MFFESPNSAAFYCRVSSDDQRERQTIDGQIDFAKKYCDLHNINLTQIYKDDGITGTLPLSARPAGGALLKDAAQGKVKTVLLYKLDRLGRDTRVILNAVAELDKLGAKVKSMTEPFDTNDASGKFLLTILAGVADLERTNILERMSMGTDRAAKTGKWLGGIVPYGYLTDEKGFLSINDAPPEGGGMSEKDVVQFIFEKLAKEKTTCPKIALELNALGVPTLYARRGITGKRHQHTRNKWTAARILRIARSTTYYGIHQYGKRTKKQRDLIERKVPAIVGKELWDEAQRTLDANQIESMRNTKPDSKYLLRMLIKCGLCGCNYGGRNSKGARYYACNGRSNWARIGIEREKRCHNISVNAKWLENLVWEDCLKYINAPSLVVKELQEHISAIDYDAEIDNVQKQIKRKAQERLFTIRQGAQQIISEQEFLETMQSLKDEINALESTLERLQVEKGKVIRASDLNAAESILERLREEISKPDLPFETKQKVIRAMVDHITITRAPEDPNRADVVIYHTFAQYIPHEITPETETPQRTGIRANNCLLEKFAVPTLYSYRKRQVSLI